MFSILSTAEGNGVQGNGIQENGAQGNGTQGSGVGTGGGDSDSSEGKASRQIKGFQLVMKQFHALLVKRFHHATRSSKDFLAQVTSKSSDCSTQTRPPVSLRHAHMSHTDAPTGLTQIHPSVSLRHAHWAHCDTPISLTQTHPSVSFRHAHVSLRYTHLAHSDTPICLTLTLRIVRKRYFCFHPCV